MNKEISDAKKNLEISRTKFSPKKIIESGNITKTNENLYIVDKDYINNNICDFKNVMTKDYKGQSIKDFLSNIEKYSIYYEVSSNKLIAGIYDIDTHKKETKVIIINDTNPLEAVLDSGYIYSANAKFFQNLLGNMK